METHRPGPRARRADRSPPARAARHAQGCREILQHQGKLGLPAGVSLAGGASVREGAGACIFSPPDGSALAFLSRGAIFVTIAGSETPRQISHHATGVSDIAWQPNGAAVYFLAADSPTDAQRERDRARGDIVVLDEFRQRHLWKVAVADGHGDGPRVK